MAERYTQITIPGIRYSSRFHRFDAGLSADEFRMSNVRPDNVFTSMLNAPAEGDGTFGIGPAVTVCSEIFYLPGTIITVYSFFPLFLFPLSFSFP